VLRDGFAAQALFAHLATRRARAEVAGEGANFGAGRDVHGFSAAQATGWFVGDFADLIHGAVAGLAAGESQP
jgi:hypothetical protein